MDKVDTSLTVLAMSQQAFRPYHTQPSAGVKQEGEKNVDGCLDMPHCVWVKKKVFIMTYYMRIQGLLAPERTF